MSNTYWQDRMAASQAKISAKSIKQIEKQLRQYYGNTMKYVISDFERVYNQVLAQQEEGKQITPALLYKLDSYWKLQGQLRQVLQSLGDKQVSALSKILEINFFDVYYSINIEGLTAFTTLDKGSVAQLINQVWVADGKSFSQRIWDNIERLMETLNEELVLCVAAGKKTTELKQKLQERFGVSYNRADTLVRTEMAHIQTQAAQKRYEDYGIQKVQFWADPDERTCDVCGKLHKKIYLVGEQMPIPAHANCRCTILPVVE